MDKSDCFYLGKITKAVGYQGELSIYLDVDNPSDYKNLESILVEVNPNSELVPFFLEQLSFGHKKTAKIRLEGVNSETDALRLVNKSVYLPESFLPELSGNQFYFHEVIGFDIVDQEKGAIGHITDVTDSAANPLFIIDFNGKELLVPIQDEVIKKVDRANKTIHILAPEGLIDLYL